MTKFLETLYDAEGNEVKTVTFVQIAPVTERAPASIEVKHPPTFPFDREYAREYTAWKNARIEAGLPWH